MNKTFLKCCKHLNSILIQKPVTLYVHVYYKANPSREKCVVFSDNQIKLQTQCVRHVYFKQTRQFRFVWGVAQLEMAKSPLTLANRTRVLFSQKTKVIHNLKSVSVGKHERDLPNA